MNASDTVTVALPRHLYELIEQRAQDADFGSAEEYIVFALTTLTEDEAAQDEQPEMTAEEEGKVMERLRGLGYIE